MSKYEKFRLVPTNTEDGNLLIYKGESKLPASDMKTLANILLKKGMPEKYYKEAYELLDDMGMWIILHTYAFRKETPRKVASVLADPRLTCASLVFAHLTGVDKDIFDNGYSMRPSPKLFNINTVRGLLE
tara:strand:- start:9768 stop:10157 length:390 start_codon:yes stop_codon:yes gene_type:complete